MSSGNALSVAGTTLRIITTNRKATMANATETPVEVSTNSNELAAIDEVISTGTDVELAINSFSNNEALPIYSTIQDESFKGRLAVASALSKSQPLDDHKGETIMLKDFVIQAVQIADDKTGEVNTAPRVTLIDADGSSYHGTSVGLVSSLRTLQAIAGHPATWDEPIETRVVEEKTRRGYKVFTLQY